MTDQELAVALTELQRIEQLARAHHVAPPEAVEAERDAALATIRAIGPVKRVFEGWIAARACRVASAQRA